MDSDSPTVPQLPTEMVAREYRAPRAPAYLVEAALEVLAAGCKLTASVRAKDIAGVGSSYGGSKDKIDEELVKQMEAGLVLLQRALG